MYLTTAKGCAWRAFYFISGKRGQHGVTRFAVSLDPTWRTNQAKLTIWVGYRKDCAGGRRGTWEWSTLLPHSRHWWRLDGRRK